MLSQMNVKDKKFYGDFCLQQVYHDFLRKISIADDPYNASAEIILYNLGNGDTVSIHNFGCFDILERKARSCPNPQTGEKVDVPAHWIPRFYPGNKMRLAVKLWEDSTKRGLR